MAESAGSPWRGYTRIRLNDATGVRSYGVSIVDVTPDTDTGDQASWEGSPGGTVTLRFEWDTSGVPVFNTADAASVRIRLLGSATDIDTWTPAISGATGSVTTTLRYTDTPLTAGGNNASGMFEVWLQVQRAAAVAWGPCDSRGTVSAGLTNTWARGKFRSRTTISAFSISDASLGGSEPSLFRATKATFNRVTLSAKTYRSVNLTLKHRQSGADVRSAADDAAAGTTAVRDYTWNATATGAGNKGRVNKDYAAALTATDARIILPSNTSGGTSDDLEYFLETSGNIAGWTRVDPSTLEKAPRFNADPRITFTQLLQVSSQAFTNQWQTTPNTGNVASGERLGADLGFLASRAADAESNGLNGIQWTDKLWDNNNLTGSEASPTKTHATTGTTQGTAAGWSDGIVLPITWDNGLPAGAWTQKQVITTADLTGLEVTASRTVTLIVADPRIFLTVGFGDPGTPLDHWYPGKALTLGLAKISTFTKGAFDAGTVQIALTRFEPATGRISYLDPTDAALNTWTPLPVGGTIVPFTASTTPAVAASAGDSDLMLLSFSAAVTGQSNWNSEDIFVICNGKILGTPFFKSHQFPVLGAKWKHSTTAPEADIVFSGTGHAHTGGTDGAAIGDRS